MKKLKNKVVASVIIASALCMQSCTPPPPIIDKSQAPSVTQAMVPASPLENIKASGSVSVSMDKEKLTGDIDVLWKSENNFRADISSPFGLIASIKNENGKVSFETAKQIKIFSIDSTIDSIPLLPETKLTFRQFSTAIIGKVPDSILNSIASREPDSVINESKTAMLLWHTKSGRAGALIDRKSLELLDFCISDSVNQGNLDLCFNTFEQGLAKSIRIKEKDTNYFSIKYAQIKRE